VFASVEDIVCILCLAGPKEQNVCDFYITSKQSEAGIDKVATQSKEEKNL
jgi:hypothetical protein